MPPPRCCRRYLGRGGTIYGVEEPWVGERLDRTRATDKLVPIWGEVFVRGILLYFGDVLAPIFIILVTPITLTLAESPMAFLVGVLSFTFIARLVARAHVCRLSASFFGCNRLQLDVLADFDRGLWCKRRQATRPAGDTTRLREPSSSVVFVVACACSCHNDGETRTFLVYKKGKDPHATTTMTTTTTATTTTLATEDGSQQQQQQQQQQASFGKDGSRPANSVRAPTQRPRAPPRALPSVLLPALFSAPLLIFSFVSAFL